MAATGGNARGNENAGKGGKWGGGGWAPSEDRGNRMRKEEGNNGIGLKYKEKEKSEREKGN
jgi:hypothetical protein